MRSLGLVTASVFAAFSLVGLAAPAEAAPAYPQADGRCVDQTEVLGKDLCAKVTAVLLRDEKADADEVAVAVVRTTGDTTIEAWSTGLFNKWGVGKKTKNNGVLLVVALEDHRVRLETGRGVRDRLTDSDAKTIIDEITSSFADNEYALGILTGLDDVRRQLRHVMPADARLQPLAPAASEPTGQDPTENSDVSTDGSEFTSSESLTPDDDSSVPILPIAILGFAVVAVVGVVISRASSNSPGRGPSSLAHQDTIHRATTDYTTSSSTSFGSSGSSGSSFGGGSSDGGGATGSW